MIRLLKQLIGLLALALIPVSLWFGLHHEGKPISPDVALWAPFAVMGIDALLIAFALGLWQLTHWERFGISVITPMLIAMLSWAVMMGSVAEQMQQAAPKAAAVSTTTTATPAAQ